MTVEIISWSISTKVWDRAGILQMLESDKICIDSNYVFMLGHITMPHKDMRKGRN